MHSQPPRPGCESTAAAVMVGLQMLLSEMARGWQPPPEEWCSNYHYEQGQGQGHQGFLLPGCYYHPAPFLHGGGGGGCYYQHHHAPPTSHHYYYPGPGEGGLRHDAESFVPECFAAPEMEEERGRGWQQPHPGAAAPPREEEGQGQGQGGGTAQGGGTTTDEQEGEEEEEKQKRRRSYSEVVAAAPPLTPTPSAPASQEDQAGNLSKATGGRPSGTLVNARGFTTGINAISKKGRQHEIPICDPPMNNNQLKIKASQRVNKKGTGTTKNKSTCEFPKPKAKVNKQEVTAKKAQKKSQRHTKPAAENKETKVKSSSRATFKSTSNTDAEILMLSKEKETSRATVKFADAPDFQDQSAAPKKEKEKEKEKASAEKEKEKSSAEEEDEDSDKGTTPEAQTKGKGARTSRKAKDTLGAYRKEKAAARKTPLLFSRFEVRNLIHHLEMQHAAASLRGLGYAVSNWRNNQEEDKKDAEFTPEQAKKKSTPVFPPFYIKHLRLCAGPWISEGYRELLGRAREHKDRKKKELVYQDLIRRCEQGWPFPQQDIGLLREEEVEWEKPFVRSCVLKWQRQFQKFHKVAGSWTLKPKKCSACGREGHSIKTHKSCPHNPKRQRQPKAIQTIQALLRGHRARKQCKAENEKDDKIELLQERVQVQADADKKKDAEIKKKDAEFTKPREETPRRARTLARMQRLRAISCEI